MKDFSGKKIPKKYNARRKCIHQPAGDDTSSLEMSKQFSHAATSGKRPAPELHVSHSARGGPQLPEVSPPALLNLAARISGVVKWVRVGSGHRPLDGDLLRGPRMDGLIGPSSGILGSCSVKTALGRLLRFATWGERWKFDEARGKNSAEYAGLFVVFTEVVFYLVGSLFGGEN